MSGTREQIAHLRARAADMRRLSGEHAAVGNCETAKHLAEIAAEMEARIVHSERRRDREMTSLPVPAHLPMSPLAETKLSGIAEST
jgi:hypothetical protein